MVATLTGRRVAFLAADGVEQVELVKPWEALREAGAGTELLSLEQGRIQAMNGDIEPADTFEVDRSVAQASVEDYDGLVIPGGTANPDNLRADEGAVRFVRAFVESGKPVASICHGPWVLVEADVVRGRTLTSYASIRTDLRNAGGQVVDQEVVTDRNVTTSRGPDDLPAFCERVIEEIARS
ncbi:type 1 glutamine amidotransferase domain-containing protein [Nocardiopsis algeriensis]|uniref:Protease I n=1 Tax=Nocardiopsis algeriensis TaxID=1478215 RepID=A0A841IMV0_9ACTN|nr:type 1 glutamine amidotransferase domain-containing protein [Nocardiopsis algeriensis]MBB6119983.1 protease I [Nocardiopsis algeriensis]